MIAGVNSILSNLRSNIYMNEDDDGTMSQEGFDFGSDLYSLAACSPDELHSSWKVFTAMKDNDLESRRMENLAWRIQAMRRQGREPSSISASDLSQPLVPAAKDEARDPRIDQLLKLALESCWPDATLQGTLDLLRTGSPAGLPLKAADLRQIYTEHRPVCAVFTHSLERNGANNFCLYISRLLLGSQYFVVFSPKEGPMRGDFEALGLEVVVVNTASATFLPDLAMSLKQRNVGCMLANTIMRCDVVLMAANIGMPSIWVIHESWPQDQFDHYAKEVFMCKDIDAAMIRGAFAAAGCIVFPSDMQKQQYNGLFHPSRARTIYNGIPLEQLDAYRSSQDRKEVRASLGYTDEDFLVLHLGTICRRKGQIYSAAACASLIQEEGLSDVKMLYVGARYIRDHEIQYIDEIKETITSKGLSWVRWEETTEENRGKVPFTLMDIQSEVLRFYMAADVVLVPSLNEVLPLVVCEAMAFERPVVCSSIDAIPEAVSDGVESLLVPPGDSAALAQAIKKLHSDPALRVKMGKAGRERVHRQFSYTSMGQGYRELVDQTSGAQRGDGGLLQAVADEELRQLAAKSSLKSPAALPAKSGELSAASLQGKKVLVDMDNTIADWDGEFIKRFAEVTKRPVEAVESLVRDRQHFEIEANFSGQDKELAMAVVQEPGLYAALEPMPGAIEGLKALLGAGADVRLVTAPHPSCPSSCASEKYKWVAKHLGEDWADRVIITRDKTFVEGDVLIDDKPSVVGKNEGRWQHVLFSASYNRAVQDKPRMASWASWEPTLTAAMGA